MNRSPRSCIALGFALLANAGAPNDGWIGYGGAPKLMTKGHPTIRMVSERVVMLIKKNTLLVDCSFVFKNEGEPTTVRMGFPDYDSRDELPSEPMKTTFEWFQSYVDGRRYKTKFIRGTELEGWQVKTVSFAPGQTRKVRNVYEVRLGGGFAALFEDAYGFTNRVAYILATGASWKGKIGRTEVLITFESAYHPRPTKLLHWTDKNEDKVNQGKIWRQAGNRGLAVCAGPSEPRLSGKTIRILRTNWEPKESDDVSIQFHYSETQR